MNLISNKCCFLGSYRIKNKALKNYKKLYSIICLLNSFKWCEEFDYIRVNKLSYTLQYIENLISEIYVVNWIWLTCCATFPTQID